MPVRREIRSSKESTKIALLSGAAAQAERQANANSRYSIWDEDKVYEPDWEISTADLETYSDIWSRD